MNKYERGSKNKKKDKEKRVQKVGVDMRSAYVHLVTGWLDNMQLTPSDSNAFTGEVTCMLATTRGLAASHTVMKEERGT